MAKSGKSAAASTVGRPPTKGVGRAGAFRIGTARAAAKASATAIGRAKKTIGPPRPTVKRLPAAELRRINALPYAQYARETARLNKGLTAQQQLDQGTFNHELVYRKKK
jgi:hypothetical protein